MRAFDLGQLYVTRGIATVMEEGNSDFKRDLSQALTQYKACDWGITCTDDQQLNNEAVLNGDDRILAVYPTCRGNIWIITEWDRSVTTILFPNEY